MTADLYEAKRLCESALICLRDAVESHRRSQDPQEPRAKALADAAADTALSAAWRLADAGLVLRRYLEAAGLQAIGLTEPTGRGVTLPRLPPKTCFVVAWTDNHGNNDMRDFWAIHNDELAANNELAAHMAGDLFYAGAVARIITGTEPQWMDGAA